MHLWKCDKKFGQPRPPSFGQNPKEQQFFLGCRPLLGAVLQLTRPTRAHGSLWLSKVSSLKIWSGVSKPSQSQLTKRQTNLATRGPPESPWQGPWPLLMSPAHSLSMENRWIPELNCFDEKTDSPGYLRVWICFALLGSCSETHSWCKCDAMVFIGKCSKKEQMLISGYFKM